MSVLLLRYLGRTVSLPILNAGRSNTHGMKSVGELLISPSFGRSFHRTRKTVKDRPSIDTQPIVYKINCVCAEQRRFFIITVAPERASNQPTLLGLSQGLPECAGGPSRAGQLFSVLQRPTHPSSVGLSHAPGRAFCLPQMKRPNEPSNAGGRELRLEARPPASLAPIITPRTGQECHHLNLPEKSSRHWGAPQSVCVA